MNRIILIGNGFDLAHGLKTSYRHFINCYWREISSKIHEGAGVIVPYNDDLVEMYIGSEVYSSLCPLPPVTSYSIFKNWIEKITGRNSSVKFEIKNEFLGYISELDHLQLWLDIEAEYYSLLKDFLKPRKDRQYAKKWPTISKLNKEFNEIKILLEKYLTVVCEKELPIIKPNKDLVEILFVNNGIERKNIALSKQTAYTDSIPNQKKKLLKITKEFIDKEEEESGQKQVQAILTGRPYVKNPLCEMDEAELEQESERSIERMGIDPQSTMVLNFNYTSTFETLYAPGADLEIVNIHGKLNNPDNPIIFGYGDELDDDYKEIEKTNDMMENIKQTAYGNTGNYRRLSEFLQLDYYQIFILGHSCGNSDRTLLNEIFEHPNCASIKLFYHKKDDGSDDFSNVSMNINRNFNNKRAFRGILVPKPDCKTHPQSTVPAECV